MCQEGMGADLGENELTDPTLGGAVLSKVAEKSVTEVA